MEYYRNPFWNREDGSAFFGGYYRNGRLAGAFCVAVYYKYSESCGALGGRLMFL